MKPNSSLPVVSSAVTATTYSNSKDLLNLLKNEVLLCSLYCKMASHWSDVKNLPTNLLLVDSS
jgi:hypothetical protein